jgi:hypothetical protein
VRTPTKTRWASTKDKRLCYKGGGITPKKGLGADKWPGWSSLQVSLGQRESRTVFLSSGWLHFLWAGIITPSSDIVTARYDGGEPCWPILGSCVPAGSAALYRRISHR